jgi:predicted  nucleic acid-binding Zn-ribbon protein
MQMTLNYVKTPEGFQTLQEKIAELERRKMSQEVQLQNMIQEEESSRQSVVELGYNPDNIDEDLKSIDIEISNLINQLQTVTSEGSQ